MLPITIVLNQILIGFPEDNDLVIPDSATIFEKPITDQWVHAKMNLSKG